MVRAVVAVRGERALARDARLESLELDGSAAGAHRGGDANPRGSALVIHELPLPREHEPRPRHLLVDRPVVDDALLVPPVRRHAGLSRAVHLGGANLHLNRASIRGDDDGVQALVAVHLGVAHVVLGLARDRGELAVDSLEGGVAVVLRVDDDANRPQVVHVAERHPLAEHLAVHREEALGAAVDVAKVGDARVGDERGGDVLDGALHRRLLLVPRELGAQRVVCLGVQVRKARILEARLEAPDAEARREGDVDGESFLGDSRGGVLAERVDGLEALEPIRELDDDDSRIRHRDEQRAELQALLSRQGPAAGALELGHERELGHAGHHGHDGVRRRVPELALRHRRVVEDVVEERRRDNLAVHAELGDDESRGNLSGEDAVAALAQLTAVRGGGHPESAHHRGRGKRVVASLRGEERRLLVGGERLQPAGEQAALSDGAVDRGLRRGVTGGVSGGHRRSLRGGHDGDGDGGFDPAFRTRRRRELAAERGDGPREAAGGHRRRRRRQLAHAGRGSGVETHDRLLGEIRGDGPAPERGHPRPRPHAVLRGGRHREPGDGGRRRGSQRHAVAAPASAALPCRPAAERRARGYHAVTVARLGR